MFELCKNIKTVDDITSTEIAYYANKFYEEGRIDYPDEVVSELITIMCCNF
jgi:hypothetical protein